MHIGYQASHEQFSPSELLNYVKLAEQAGFTAVNSSDHFFPWSERQGQCGYAFAWLGAAMQQTQISYSSVCAPGQRYHPAIVAQAIATLGEMFPSRFSIALASGEAINECITGEKWPIKSIRHQRLLECVNIIRRLLAGENVTHHGLVTVEEAKLYTLPKETPLLFGAAVTKETAAFLGTWADGMITVHQPHRQMKEVVEAFRNNGGEGKPVHLKVQLSYANTDDEAITSAHEQWRTNIFSSNVLADIRQLQQFDILGEFVKPEDMKDMVRMSSSIEQHIVWLQKDMELGFDRIILHNVNRQQEMFIEDFGEEVLPKLKM